jgi:hypothetical protein
MLLALPHRSMVFIWDAEAMQLHGVFKVDSGASFLPAAEIPGGRPYHVSTALAGSWHEHEHALGSWHEYAHALGSCHAVSGGQDASSSSWFMA